MLVLVNGMEREDACGLTLAQFIAQEGFDSARVACELNGEIVARAHYGDCLLAEAGRLEIVHFVGGG
ncbi:MAG: sulfur carrier protein ThiS [Raoultibacter sp.]